MSKRFVTIWFRYLKTDWLCRRQPELLRVPFVLALPDHGKMIVTAANILAEKEGIYSGIAVADARAIIPGLKVIDDKQGLSIKILKSFAKYFIRYTPCVAIDQPNGLILDVTGCAHLWGGEIPYVNQIKERLKNFGYDIKIAMADTIGTAWAISRFDNEKIIINKNEQYNAILSLSPTALRLEENTIGLLFKLGLKQVQSFIGMPRSTLKRRFGDHLLLRIDQALGYEEEVIKPVHESPIYHEWLPCPDFIVNRTGIEIALEKLLEKACSRLRQEQKGIRLLSFKCYRVDGKILQIDIGTNRPSHNPKHLFKLFEIKLDTIEPDLGIELFVLEANKIEELLPIQEKLWVGNCGLHNVQFSELIDRIANRIGSNNIHRYLPDEHYWPERSIRLATSVDEESTTTWRVDKPRPIQLLASPEIIEVTAPIPDYPPMLFRYKGKMHKINKADGPERIEREWWIEEGLHRDYYSVEDEEGSRYWLFRLGHYTGNKNPQWYIHGFFA